ncbi:MAG TPA: 4-alpha-glucanotransferase [Ferruginibacter sp.]|nr:4-alpha-glucanotransferase [Ferruginibacter sp.]
MVVCFYCKFSSVHGQTLSIRLSDAGSNSLGEEKEFPMQYLNDQYWNVVINPSQYDFTDKLAYTYILTDTANNTREEYRVPLLLNAGKLKSPTLDVFDEWAQVNLYKSVFNSIPFKKVFKPIAFKPVKKISYKNATHIFKIDLPELEEGKIICITGSGKKFHQWNEQKPLLLSRTKAGWDVKLNLIKEEFPIEYKYGIYDINEKKIIQYEQSGNRLLLYPAEKNKKSLFHEFPSFTNLWKGAGLNIPVSALRTEQSWAIGDFSALHLLSDWAKEAGLKLIQLLPVNDTTATYTRKDSYPYAAISAFALHPVYLDVQKLAIAFSVVFPVGMTDKVKELNDMPGLNYEEISRIKMEAIRMLFEKEKHFFKDDFAWFEFFELNRHWLGPYAAFCYLRDKYQSPEFNNWEQFSVYNEEAIQDLISPDKDHYDEIAIHYFIQYHLYLQLKDAADYAHKNGIILKGDLPIGVARWSTDSWMFPQLFNMDMQAGAPPDAFATKGQNWEFPTYNWKNMEADNFVWWRQRMEHLSTYFDAVRIDHVLGFFRIWSIPAKEVEGILGKFVPAQPLPLYDFTNAGITFDEDRYCLPFFTDEILSSTFGDKTKWVKDTFIEGNRLKEGLNNQRAIESYFRKNPENIELKTVLFGLVSNVILLKDENEGHYHFRIGMLDSMSFKYLPEDQQEKSGRLYDQYFYHKQNGLWKEEGVIKLTALKNCTDMLLCAEDLGMVPEMVEGVLANMEILALQVERMPKKLTESYSHPKNAGYLSVVTPSTHDMSTIREWWEEDRKNTQYFYNHLMGHYGTAPYFCEPWICKEIILQHIYSPAMWSIFLLQDLMAMDENLRRENPKEERINIPADTDHDWNFRMHITLENLLEQKDFTQNIRNMILESGR